MKTMHTLCDLYDQIHWQFSILKHFGICSCCFYTTHFNSKFNAKSLKIIF